MGEFSSPRGRVPMTMGSSQPMARYRLNAFKCLLGHSLPFFPLTFIYIKTQPACLPKSEEKQKVDKIRRFLVLIFSRYALFEISDF